METRREISEDHWHRDQANYDPTTPGGAVLRSMLSPAPQHEGRAAALREAWAPRIVDPRTMDTTLTIEELPQ